MVNYVEVPDLGALPHMKIPCVISSMLSTFIQLLDMYAYNTTTVGSASNVQRHSILIIEPIKHNGGYING